jgi:hypothetical protein
MQQFIPEHREVHVCCVFTWDISYGEELAYQWEGITNKPVKIGGPAYGNFVGDSVKGDSKCKFNDTFTPGLYIKENIIMTTRGCNNQCPHCIVPKIEGRLREIEIHSGNWIQDNNFLQASRAHKNKVFEMLRTQKGICFKGGLSAELIDSHFIENITSLRISELWLACDSDEALPKLKIAVQRLTKAGFNRRKIKCYALVGKNIKKDEARLREIYHSGAMPFAMLYRDFSKEKTVYPKETERWARQWQRPAATIAHMEKNTHF